MNQELLENQVMGTEEIEKEKIADTHKESYERYKALGGIINEKDYQSAISKTIEIHTLDRDDPQVRSHVAQAEGIAKHAGIQLHNLEGALDPKVLLYVVLRSDVKPQGVENHHSQMSDEKLFAEVLRMYEDVDSLDKLIKAYPKVSSNYAPAEPPVLVP